MIKRKTTRPMSAENKDLRERTANACATRCNECKAVNPGWYDDLFITYSELE